MRMFLSIYTLFRAGGHPNQIPINIIIRMDHKIEHKHLAPSNRRLRKGKANSNINFFSAIPSINQSNQQEVPPTRKALISNINIFDQSDAHFRAN